MTSIAKTFYIDKLDDIVIKYNNTCHSTIKMKHDDVKSNTYIDSSKEINNKDPKFQKLVILLEYQNIKIFLPKVTVQISLKKFLWLRKVKNTVLWTYVINDLNGEKIVGTFYEKELWKANQKEFRIQEVIKRKGDKLYIKWKGYVSLYNSWIDKKDSINEWIFSKTKFFRNKCKDELDLPNYATRTDLKNAAGVDTSFD